MTQDGSMQCRCAVGKVEGLNGKCVEGSIFLNFSVVEYLPLLQIKIFCLQILQIMCNSTTSTGLAF